MNDILERVKQDMSLVISEWIESDYLKQNDIFVIGCSTSEVAGKQIGTSGSEHIASILFQELQRLITIKNIHLAFQCCEHLNRALVVEKKVVDLFHLEEVSVIPKPDAGGSMASYAYKHFNHPVVVECIQANAGMDIGDTLIGMHLKNVAVPVRFSQQTVGNAHLTSARTRPKLIGGARAIYD